MHSLYLGVAIAALVANAEPILAPRATCNRDNCLRQIAASAFPGGPARGSSDCAAFMTTNLTPCPTTMLLTTTDNAGTTTLTTTITVSSTTVSVSTPVTTTTTIVQQQQAGKKRLVPRAPGFPPGLMLKPGYKIIADGVLAKSGNLKRMPDAPLVARQASCSGGTLTSSTARPAYASSCGSPSQYSSACSCNGIFASTSTLPRSTVTSTVSAVVTRTSTSTVTLTFTSTSVAATRIETATSVSSAPPPGSTCDPGNSGTNQCSNGQTCSLIIQCPVKANENDCYNSCTGSCVAASFNGPTGQYANQCTLFLDCCT